MKKFLGCFLCMMLLVFTAPAAQALQIYQLNYAAFDIGIAPPYGTVTLEAGEYGDDSSNDDIMVTVSLDAALGFIRTGAGGGSNFLFNAVGVTTNDIVPVASVFGVDTEIVADGSSKTNATPPIHSGGFGDFDFGVSFIPLQDFGAGSPIYNPDLVFWIKDVVYADFYANTYGTTFAADVFSRTSGFTGMIGDGPRSVPEPATMLLLGSG